MIDPGSIRLANLTALADCLSDALDAAAAHLQDLRAEIATMEAPPQEPAFLHPASPPALSISDHARAILEGADWEALVAAWTASTKYGHDERFAAPATFLRALITNDADAQPTTPEPLRIEVGGVYWTRDGRMAIVGDDIGEGDCPFVGAISGYGTETWTRDGRFSIDGSNRHLDIVAQWSDDEGGAA